MKVLRGTLALASVFGFQPHQFVDAKDGRIRVTRSSLGLALLAANVGVYTVAVVWLMQSPERYVETGFQIVDSSGHLMLVAAFFATILMVVRKLVKGRNTEDLLNGLRSIQRRMVTLGVDRAVHVAKDREFWIVTLGIIVLQVGSACYNSVTIWMVQGSAANKPAMFGVQVLASCAAGFMCTYCNAFVHTAHVELAAINEFMRFALQGAAPPADTMPPIRKRKTNLKSQEVEARKSFINNLSLLLDDIHSQSCRIGADFGLEIACVSLGIVLFCTITVFAFYQTLSTTSQSTMLVTSMYLVWNFTYCFNFLTLVGFCHRLQNEGNRTVALLTHAASQETNLAVHKKLHSLLCQLAHNPTKISTEFFDVNLRVFYEMFGTVATYLFILMQFDN